MTIEELIHELKQHDEFILAIDGMCASGKTTLANQLQEQLDAHVFHMDDFFLPASLRTVERMSEPGGNIHYERFVETVLEPLRKHDTVHYQQFSCQSMDYKQPIDIKYSSRNIIEGSYALRPELIPYYSHIVVLKITPQIQRERLKQRNPEKLQQFIERWIPLENKYFDYYQIFDKYTQIDT